jgi:hypothetical protein
MQQPDPFADSAFLGRLNKLLSLLGSGQPAEAEAARRKLVEHLAQNRLSFTDLANRLADPANAPSFLGGAREIHLERQLAAARVAKEEAAREAIAAAHRVEALQVEIQQASFDIGRALQALARARTLAAVGWVAGALGLAAAFLPGLMPAANRAGTVRTAIANPTGPLTVQPNDFGSGDALLRLGPHERPGSAAVNDLPIRLEPNNDATIRAFLTYGDRVVIEREARVGAQTWLLVRSMTGSGWVRSGDVLH